MALHSRRTRVILLGSAVATIVATTWFAEHIHWAITGPSGIEQISTRPLVDSPPPAEYVDCSIGSLKIRIPPSLRDSAKATGGRAVAFEDNKWKLGVFVPKEVLASERAAWMEATDELPERYRYSRKRVQAAIYSMSSGDFHWGMSREDLRWLKWLTRRAAVSRSLLAVESVETLFKGDIEATLLWMANGKYAILEWETPDLHAAGAITFSQDGPIQRDWVRYVCTSLRFDGKGYSLPMDDGDIMSMVRME